MIRYGRVGVMAAIGLLAAWAPPVGAKADDRSAGAVTVQALLYEPASNTSGYGAGALVDLWKPYGPFRVGGVLGTAALSSKDASISRTFLPVGLSLAVVVPPRSFGFDLRVRGGAWAGAYGNGLAAGGWVAAGAYIEYAPDDDVAIAAGTDVWFLFGHGGAYVLAPGIGLVWTLGSR